MNEEFNLGNKGEIGDCVCGDEFDRGACLWFNENDVKEFIKRLKEEMRKELNESFGESNWINWHEEIIDKLAGDKLTKKEKVKDE